MPSGPLGSALSPWGLGRFRRLRTDDFPSELTNAAGYWLNYAAGWGGASTGLFVGWVSVYSRCDITGNEIAAPFKRTGGLREFYLDCCRRTDCWVFRSNWKNTTASAFPSGCWNAGGCEKLAASGGASRTPAARHIDHSWSYREQDGQAEASTLPRTWSVFRTGRGPSLCGFRGWHRGDWQEMVLWIKSTSLPQGA